MITRVNLQKMLEKIACPHHVYFQPPESLYIDYPCIIYHLKNVKNTYADNDIYKQDKFYELIVVDSNPDSILFHKICKLPECKFRNFYVSENLNHFVFDLYTYKLGDNYG